MRFHLPVLDDGVMDPARPVRDPDFDLLEVRKLEPQRKSPKPGDSRATVRSMDHALLVKVYPVVDAIGGTSPEAHRAGLDRVIQAGGQPISWVSLARELQHGWARQQTVPSAGAVTGKKW